MPLDSDEPDADAKLHVTFYKHQREPHVGDVFVRIMTPGDQLNIYDQPANEGHKRRFARHWLAFQMQENGGDGAAFGTPLAQWERDAPEQVSGSQVTELGILHFQTVEQVAQASDAQIQRVGMGGAGLRERARGYLANKNRSETDLALEAANARADRLEAQMSALMERMGAQSDEKRGPGRPRKVTEDVLDGAAANQPSPG